jgi:hypothetical protein
MTDDEFLGALERCELPVFGHAEHVRVAYLYLSTAPFDEAVRHVRRALQRYAAHAGQPERYDDAMTIAYLTLIHRRMDQRRDVGGWAAFARANPDLFALRLSSGESSKLGSDARISTELPRG